MTEKTLHIVQQFEKMGGKLVSGRAMEFPTAEAAIARAERDAPRIAGVVALTQVIDLDTDEVVEEPRVLVRFGELPKEFQPED